MVKFINISFLILLALSCKKDKTPDSLEFLYGEWKFIKGAVGEEYLFFPQEFHYEEINCKLKFERKGKLVVTYENNAVEFSLIYRGIIEQEDFKLITFEDGGNKVFRFSFIPSRNLLECEQLPLPLYSPTCFEYGGIKYSQYEKI